VTDVYVKARSSVGGKEFDVRGVEVGVANTYTIHYVSQQYDMTTDVD